MFANVKKRPLKDEKTDKLGSLFQVEDFLGVKKRCLGSQNGSDFSSGLREGGEFEVIDV